MGKCFVLAFMISLAMMFSGTAFAASLNITSNAVALPAQSNLSSNVTMLNLTVIHDADYLNLTYINFTFNSTTSGANGSTTGIGVCVFNRTLAELLNCSYNWSFNQTNVTFGLNMTNNTNYTLLVTYSILPNATNPTNVSVFISSNISIGTNATTGSLNISNSIFPISSNFTIIRIASASSSITPIYVDTNVTSQTFRYNVVNISADSFESVKIIIPQNFNLVSVVNWTYLKTDLNTTTGTGCSTNCTIIGNEIIISDYVGIRNITVYFNANTNASPVNSMSFNSTLNGTNAHDINTVPVSVGAINVTTKQLISIANITSVKNSAFINGTDYWEFSLILNITNASIGIVQFKMANWNSTSAGSTGNLSLQNSTTGDITYYATLRGASDFSTTNKFSVANDYNASQGVYINATGTSLYTAILRMVIPLGTPVASDWWTTYKILFRTQP